jgi:zinc protease
LTQEPETAPSTLSAAGVGSTIAASDTTAAGGRIPPVPFEKYTLPNGLDVILHEDHSTPIVCVNVWYHVGSKNEERGRTGFAHLFEHMMFQGSEHHNSEYFGPLQEAGGRLNGSTNDDRTNYWEVVPSNYLELALWMESDRMGFLLPAMSQEKLDNQRDVVKNERRQSYENRPYGLAAETIAAAMYPHDHPYSWPTIGYMDDITAATRDDIAQFFRRYYHPANASLCIAGDFDPRETRRLVDRYFGSLAPGPRIEKMSVPTPMLPAEKRILMRDRVGLPRLYLNWHTVPADAIDDAELDLLASVLAGGKSSRLYRSLVLDKQLAQDVAAFQRSGEIAGSFTITATAKPGVTLAQLEAAIAQEVAGIQSSPPTPSELERAVNRFETQFVVAMESVGGFGGVADRLNRYNVMNDDPGHATKDFERYLKVDTAGVVHVARKYLADRRVVLAVEPGAERTIMPDPIAENAADAARAAALPRPGAKRIADRPAQPGAASFDRSKMPTPASPPKFALPPVHRSRLSNGLEVVVVEHHELPIVTLNLLNRSGNASNPTDRLGLANLVAAMLDEGTATRTSEDVADQLAVVGSSLSIRADWDTTRTGLFTLKRHLDHSLDIFADVLLRPTFPAAELERQRSLALTNLVRLRDQPTVLAGLAIDAVLYGAGHPYGRPEMGNEKSLRAISRGDVARFYESHLRPNNGSLIVVGDITPAEVMAALETALGQWLPGSPDAVSFPDLRPRPGTTITLVDKPAAAQSVIGVGHVGVTRKSPDYFSLIVMNAILGGLFTSRLNMNLREDKGFTYGARSSFEWRKQPGPFVASASVQTAVTAAAIAEFLKEFHDIAGGRPVTDAELDYAKASITRGFPGGFETARDIAGRVEMMVEFELAGDYFDKFVANVSAVTAADVLRAAQRFIDNDHLSIIVVGDASQIESPLREIRDGIGLHRAEFDDEFGLVVGQA